MQSVSSPSGPPAPQSGTEPGAMNSESLNTSGTMLLAALLKSPPTKSTSSSFMCAYKRCRSAVAASRFLNDYIVQVDRAQGDRLGGFNWWPA